jgi:hypothetical protein
MAWTAFVRKKSTVAKYKDTKTTTTITTIVAM